MSGEGCGCKRCQEPLPDYEVSHYEQYLASIDGELPKQRRYREKREEWAKLNPIISTRANATS